MMATAATLGGPLTLADEGSFFVNGQSRLSNYPGASLVTGPAPAGNITVNQMYVHYRIPATAKGVPLVMVHGSNHTGMTYETTPDGREGWATWFVRQGHPVYVVDHSGRGRSGFDPTPVNAVRDGGADPKALPTFFLGPIDRAWWNFRFGPDYPKPFPNLQFPLEAIDQYLAQLVPNAETTLAGGGANTVNALVALLDKIGPAVVMVHSQSGVYGLDVVRKRPNLVRALISVEGGCETVTPADIATPFVKVPVVSVWGDNSIGAKGVNGDKRREGCAQAVNMIKGGGGRATFLLLPEAGIAGNSHMMMMDKNNLVVAEALRKWVAENVK
ncbi:MAG TPA: lysophospholipase [Burkholderiales bacterium]|nr:lysophospholipase [Burkholderiales bacterium]